MVMFQFMVLSSVDSATVPRLQFTDDIRVILIILHYCDNIKSTWRLILLNSNEFWLPLWTLSTVEAVTMWLLISCTTHRYGLESFTPWPPNHRYFRKVRRHWSFTCRDWLWEVRWLWHHPLPNRCSWSITSSIIFVHASSCSLKHFFTPSSTWRVWKAQKYRVVLLHHVMLFPCMIPAMKLMRLNLAWHLFDGYLMWSMPVRFGSSACISASLP